ncbi:uncharacterized protein LOC124265238 [Haliotis rubra]|uniref:uncharacterized protein LOC124265238 n=1 Tax=Haliotis rubra TaxID=36100 RepID=UPI001EE58C88|nr:uncharacterized protein LOC124265238 [Haliotis rubra]
MAKTYFRFCLYFALIPVPASGTTLLRYRAFLARSLSPSSIPGYLNMVRLLHLEAGLDDPLTDWTLGLEIEKPDYTNNVKQLCISDVVWYDNYVELIVRHTKTIQFGQRVLRVPLSALPGSPLCPGSAPTWIIT